MNNRNSILNNSNKVIAIILLAVGGVVCLFHLGVKLKNALFIAGSETTQGIVVDVQTQTTRSKSRRNTIVRHSHTMTVAYTVNGKEYTKVFNSGEEVVSEGKNVIVYYKKNNPKKAVTNVETKKGLDFMFPVMIVLGVIFWFADPPKNNSASSQHPFS